MRSMLVRRVGSMVSTVWDGTWEKRVMGSARAMRAIGRRRGRMAMWILLKARVKHVGAAEMR
jgi:xanthine/CO dehydrogenase XdhC/CoxF family maturation factor